MHSRDLIIRNSMHIFEIIFEHLKGKIPEGFSSKNLVGALTMLENILLCIFRLTLTQNRKK